MNKSPYRVVLTGATGGIGQAIARQLAKESAWMILVGRNREALASLQSELGHRSVHIVDGDLTQAETLERIAQLAVDLGGLNLVINNAGANDFHAFETQPDEHIRKLLDTNLLAPMLLSRRLIPLLRQSLDAQLVNTGSVFGQMGFPGYAAYCASKAGLRGFTQALRRELADTSIRVRYFAPRATRTDINPASVDAMNRELKTAQDAPEHVASELMHFLQGTQWEKTLGAKESFFILVNKLLPSLPDKAIRSQLPIIRKHLPK
ncbi:MAG: SDR family oxidoreductase [Burkholderiaceae bacterium]